MKCRDVATRLRRALSISTDFEEVNTPSNVRQMRHAQLHASRIRDHCLTVHEDPSKGSTRSQQCSSTVLIMSEEDAMIIIKLLEARND